MPSTVETKTKKSSKKSTKTEVTSDVTTPTVAEPKVVAPVSEPVPTDSVPTLESTVVESTVVESVVESVDESNTEILFNKLNNQFHDVLSVMKTLQSNIKILQKEVLRERKESKKKESKHSKKSDKKRKPNGFAKPALISNDLALFLGIPEGSELARTEVTSKIIAYVKEHNLQNPEKKKEFIPDAKLSALLKPGPNDIITYFNLQTFLKTHFASNKTIVSTESVQVV
jgi:upstream activation factor subunit UAF30